MFDIVNGFQIDAVTVSCRAGTPGVMVMACEAEHDHAAAMVLE